MRQHVVRLLGILSVVAYFTGAVFAATYNLPAAIGSSPFGSCSFTSGTTYSCTNTVSIDNNDTVNFTQAMTLAVTGSGKDFVVGNNAVLNGNGYAVTITANHDIQLGNAFVGSINFIAGNTFQAGNTATITGNITAANDIQFGNGTSVTGTVTAGDQLSVGGGTINGTCSYSTTNYTCTSSPLKHIWVVHSGTGGTCSGGSITLKACTDATTATCSTLYAGGVSVTLSGYPSNPVSIGASGQATVTYTASTAGTVRHAVTSHTYMCENSSTATAANTTTECDMLFSDNEFVVTSADTLGTTAVAGRPHAMTVTAYKKETATGQCGIATGYTGSKNLRAWYADLSSLSPAPSAPALSLASSCVSSTTLAATEPSSGTNISGITFSSGSANFWACTSDVGKFSISFRDIGSPVIATGTTSTLTVRPFALYPVVAGSSASTPATLANNGALFTNGGASTVTAGDAFTATVKALLWQQADDDGTGSPLSNATLSDNGTTPSFSGTVPLSVTGAVPSVASPLLREATTAAAGGSWSSGTWTGTLHYDNVGAIQLQAGPMTNTSYLGTTLTIPGATSSTIGRFKPHHFGVASPSFTAGCGAGSTLTYLGQNFTTSFNVQALINSTTPTVATGYGASGYAPVATGSRLTLLASSGSTSFDSATATGILPNASATGTLVLQVPATGAGVWSSGAVSYPGTSGQTGSFKVYRGTSPSGPYASMAVTVRFTDNNSDAVPFWGLSTVTASPSCASGGTCTAQLGTTDMRYGRARASNAFGAASLNLAVPLVVEYWAGASWTTNTLDQGCTTLPSPTITKTSGSGTISVASSSLTTSVSSPGVFGLTLASTGAAAADLAFTGVGSWLQFPWQGGATMVDPSAKVSFGIYKGNSRIIYRREVR